MILLRSLGSESSRHLSNTLTVQMKSPTDQRKTLHYRHVKVYHTRTTAPFKSKHPSHVKPCHPKKERKINKIISFTHHHVISITNYSFKICHYGLNATHSSCSDLCLRWQSHCNTWTSASILLPTLTAICVSDSGDEVLITPLSFLVILFTVTNTYVLYVETCVDKTIIVAFISTKQYLFLQFSKTVFRVPTTNCYVDHTMLKCAL